MVFGLFNVYLLICKSTTSNSDIICCCCPTSFDCSVSSTIWKIVHNKLNLRQTCFRLDTRAENLNRSNMHLISARMKWICLELCKRSAFRFCSPSASSCQIHKAQAKCAWLTDSQRMSCPPTRSLPFPTALELKRTRVLATFRLDHGLFRTLNLFGSIKILLNKYLMREQLKRRLWAWRHRDLPVEPSEQQPGQMIYDLRSWPGLLFSLFFWARLMVHNWFLCLLCWPSCPKSAIAGLLQMARS